MKNENDGIQLNKSWQNKHIHTEKEENISKNCQIKEKFK